CSFRLCSLWQWPVIDQQRSTCCKEGECWWRQCLATYSSIPSACFSPRLACCSTKDSTKAFASQLSAPVGKFGQPFGHQRPCPGTAPRCVAFGRSPTAPTNS